MDKNGLHPDPAAVGEGEGETDVLWGIERDPSSATHGQVVCPIIILWNQPPVLEDIRTTDSGVATLVRGDRFAVAVVEHGTGVRVQDSVKAADGRPYYKVRPDHGEWVGWVRSLRARISRTPISGWVPATMLLRAGAGWWRKDWA